MIQENFDATRLLLSCRKLIKIASVGCHQLKLDRCTPFLVLRYREMMATSSWIWCKPSKWHLFLWEVGLSIVPRSLLPVQVSQENVWKKWKRNTFIRQVCILIDCVIGKIALVWRPTAYHEGFCTGSIAQHNVEHPDVSLRINDLLLKINGEDQFFKSDGKGHPWLVSTQNLAEADWNLQDPDISILEKAVAQMQKGSNGDNNMHHLSCHLSLPVNPLMRFLCGHPRKRVPRWRPSSLTFPV